MKKMIKSFISFLFVLAAFSMSAEIQPVDHMTILGKDKVYTADQIDVLLQNAGKVKKIVAGQNITISPSSGEGNVTISAQGGQASKKIAMFIIPMNETSSTDMNNSFKHFELKASLNNFQGWGGEMKCCYYVHSGHADEAGILENDKAMIFVNHKYQDWHTDERSCYKVPNTIEYLEDYAPESYVVFVDASQCWSRRSDGSWIDSENERISWTFVKTKNGSREVDAGTDHALWRPISPVRWFNSLPGWVY